MSFSLDADRGNASSTVIHNPNARLALSEQRRRLPVYEHRCAMLTAVCKRVCWQQCSSSQNRPCSATCHQALLMFCSSVDATHYLLSQKKNHSTPSKMVSLVAGKRSCTWWSATPSLLLSARLAAARRRRSLSTCWKPAGVQVCSVLSCLSTEKCHDVSAAFAMHELASQVLQYVRYEQQ